MQTILIIDDDISIGNLEQEVLEQTGYQVLRACSGTEAVLLLKSCRPDLILLDLMLPGLSGEEVLPQIHNIPVIVVSAKTAVQNTRALNAHKALCAAPISMGRGETPVELRPEEVPSAASSRPFCLFCFLDRSLLFSFTDES